MFFKNSAFNRWIEVAQISAFYSPVVLWIFVLVAHLSFGLFATLNPNSPALTDLFSISGFIGITVTFIAKLAANQLFELTADGKVMNRDYDYCQSIESFRSNKEWGKLFLLSVYLFGSIIGPSAIGFLMGDGIFIVCLLLIDNPGGR